MSRTRLHIRKEDELIGDMNKRALYELMPRSMRQNKEGISSFTVSIPTETKQYAKRPFKRLDSASTSSTATEENLLNCKICGQIFQTLNLLQHHLTHTHKVNTDELENWMEHCNPSNMQNDDNRKQTASMGTSTSNGQPKMQEDKQIYERVNCSLCHKNLFRDCIREHLKRVHGFIMDNAKAADFIGERIMPENENKLSNEQTPSNDDCMEKTSRTVPLAACTLCQKILRRDGIREHLRTKHDIETGNLIEAQPYIEEKEMQEVGRNRKEHNIIKEMYKNSYKDEFGRVFCVLCTESVFPGYLRPHLSTVHNIPVARLSTRNAVIKYSMRLDAVLDGRDQLMLTTNDPEEFDTEMPNPKLTNGPSERDYQAFLSYEPLDMVATSNSGLCDETYGDANVNGVEIKQEMTDEQ